jgi:hypothetical protein
VGQVQECSDDRAFLHSGKAAQMIFVAENPVTKQIVRQEVLSQLDMCPHALLTAEQSMAIDDAFDLADNWLDLGLL